MSGAGTLVGTPDTFTELRTFIDKDSCFNALLQLDPTYPKANIYGDIVIIPEVEFPQFYTIKVDETIVLNCLSTTPGLNDTTIEYQWSRAYPTGDFYELPGETNPTYSFTSTTSDKFIIWCNVTASAPDNWKTATTFKFNVNVDPSNT